MPTADAKKEILAPAALPRGPYAIAPEVVAADQRRRLLAAVPSVVAEYGIEAATVDQIVKVAAVKRNSFYEQFEDKLDCVAAAYEIAQERVLGAITFQCYARSRPSDRIASALAAALELLAREPDLAQLVVLEAPAAGTELAERHHRWLGRYGRMLRFATVGAAGAAVPGPAIEPAIVGGVVSQIKTAMLADEGAKLAEQGPELAAFALSFYGLPEASRCEAGGESVQPQSPERRDALVSGTA